MAREVVAMVVLGGPEGLGGDDFSDDGVFEERLGGGDGGAGLGFLFGGMEKDGGSVLCARVVALAVEGGGVVNEEEDFEEIGERDEAGVEFDLDNLGMAGFAGADFLVGGLDGVAAHVAGVDGGDAADFEVDGFEAPEAAAGESGEGGPRGHAPDGSTG